MVTVAAQANPAAAKSRIPSVLKSPLAIEVKPVMPTSLPATEYTDGAANVGSGPTCDEDKEANQHARRHKPKKSPNLHCARPTRKHRNFPLKLLSDSENPRCGRAFRDKVGKPNAALILFFRLSRKYRFTPRADSDKLAGSGFPGRAT